MHGIWAYLSTFSRFWVFIWKLGSKSATTWKVGSGSGSASKWQAGSGHGSTSMWYGSAPLAVGGTLHGSRFIHLGKARSKIQLAAGSWQLAAGSKGPEYSWRQRQGRGRARILLMTTERQIVREGRERE
jgi:hypothetical protein